MSKEKRRVPKLRFPGFTEDWEQRKLSEITTCFDNLRVPVTTSDRVSGKTPYYGANGIQDYVSGNTHSGEFVLIAEDGANDLNDYPVQYVNGEIWVNNHAHVIAGFKEKLDNKFLSYALKTVKMTTFIVGSGRSKLNLKALLEIPISMPNYNEQCFVGKFIDKIDTNITLHQRKLEHLNLKKKALLQKLFPKNGECYPELRFPGFTDAWEQRKLCQITTRVTRKNGSQSDLPLTISAQDGLVDQRKYFNRQVASRDMSNYYLIKKGEFAYNKSYSEGYPFGAVKRLDYYDIGALSTLYILFEITDNISSDFIVSYYMTHLWYKEISKRAAEGARNHGLLNISTEDFFDSELNIPTSIEEQVKIGNFIKQFDKFITLHQRKLDHLQLQKKALLQQMFV